jgi:hypothetical protein
MIGNRLEMLYDGARNLDRCDDLLLALIRHFDANSAVALSNDTERNILYLFVIDSRYKHNSVGLSKHITSYFMLNDRIVERSTNESLNIADCVLQVSNLLRGTNKRGRGEAIERASKPSMRAFETQNRKRLTCVCASSPKARA